MGFALCVHTFTQVQQEQVGMLSWQVLNPHRGWSCSRRLKVQVRPPAPLLYTALANKVNVICSLVFHWLDHTCLRDDIHILAVKKIQITCWFYSKHIIYWANSVIQALKVQILLVHIVRDVTYNAFQWGKPAALSMGNIQALALCIEQMRNAVELVNSAFKHIEHDTYQIIVLPWFNG